MNSSKQLPRTSLLPRELLTARCCQRGWQEQAGMGDNAQQVFVVNLSCWESHWGNTTDAHVIYRPSPLLHIAHPFAVVAKFACAATDWAIDWAMKHVAYTLSDLSTSNGLTRTSGRRGPSSTHLTHTSRLPAGGHHQEYVCHTRDWHVKPAWAGLGVWSPCL